MHINDVWLDLLDRQATTVLRATLDLEAARRANWKVLRAELELDSVTRAYHRLLEDAPWIVSRFHVQEITQRMRES